MVDNFESSIDIMGYSVNNRIVFSDLVVAAIFNLLILTSNSYLLIFHIWLWCKGITTF